MSSSVGAGSNASDVGLIVQGTLILLSAVVAIAGYAVQARMKAAERKRELAAQRAEHANQLRLARLRLKISDFVGPATQHCLSLTTNFVYLEIFLQKQHPEEWQRYRDEEDAQGRTGKRRWQGHWNKKWTSAGPYIEAIIRGHPESKTGRNYLQVMRSTVRKFAVPLTDLINAHGQYLQHWGDKEAWKKRFPGSADNGLARNLFPTQLVRWTAEMEEIIACWDKGDYTQLFTEVNPYPNQLIRQFTQMVSELREMENQAGLASHALEEEDNSSAVPKTPRAASPESQKVKAKRYVVASAAGAVGGGVVAAVMGSKQGGI